jgi:DNA polymerase I-like protein with 3'-5' exonuclease and polymerase domains
LAAENICQAAAADILRASLRQLDGVVLHVHDEIVLEVPASDADAAVAMLHSVMCTPPSWAIGLPLEAEIGVMGRYGK